MTSKRITSHAIESIKSASISQVVGHYVPLKKKGANYEACCPFHNEKSASFTVSEAKDMYKCFGCGAGGDAIRFVMEHQKQSFIEAVTTISQITGIALEYEEREYTEAEKQTLSAAEAQEAVLNHVIPVYRQQLYDLPADHPVKQYLYTRGFTDEVIAEWQLGWAGTDWHHITPQLINKGWHEAATKLGIIKRSKSSDSNFDGYRSRITIPISDRSGRYIGLAGRFLLIDPADEGKEFPKYINPADCELYNKSTVLFGLNKAANAIRKTKCAVLVEGNLDVIAMHSKGIENTVGTSGTAFTKQQMAALKKHSTSIACMFDNDDAGQKAFQRSLPELLSNGFQVSRVPYTGKDPDEWVQKNGGSELSLPKTEDAVLFRCRELMEDAADDVMKKSDAKRLVLELVAEVANDILRSNYLDTIISKYKWNKGETKRQFDLIASLSSNGDGAEGADDDGPIKLPDWLSEDQREHFMTNGYVPVRRQVNGKWAVGYWGFNQNGKQEISNFTVQPLFHVYAGAESRYMLQIDNGYRKAVLDIPAKSIPSIDQFQAFTVAEGNYL
ncbi:MAG: DNA primase, partial [Chitinophagaceae bacterium]